MGRIRIVLAAICALLTVATGMAIAHAEGFQSGTDVTVASGETVNKTLFVSGATINIAGTVNGDVFCLGQSISITGAVNGDVICAGQNIHIAGKVNGNVRIAGQSITLGGIITRNVSMLGQSVTMDANGKVEGDMSVAGQDVTLNGAIGRDLATAAEVLTINGSVGRDVQARDKAFTLGGNATIGGAIRYVSMDELKVLDGARIAGKVTRTAPPQSKPDNRVAVGAFISGSIGFAIYLFFALLCAALLLTVLLPQVFQTVTDTGVQDPLKALLFGLLAGFGVPVGIFLLLLTVFGIPFAILAALVWVVILCFAGAVSAYYVGRIVLGKQAANALIVMLVGASMLLIAYFIPILGGIVAFVAMSFGVGMLALQLPRLPRPNYTLGQPVSSRRAK